MASPLGPQPAAPAREPGAAGGAHDTYLRAIRWLTAAHAFGLVLVAVLMGAFFWYVLQSEDEAQRQALLRDVDSVQQEMRLRLRNSLDEVAAAGLEWDYVEAIGDGGSAARVRGFLERHPEALYVAAVDETRRVRWLIANPGNGAPAVRQPGRQIEDSQGFGSLVEAGAALRPVFSPPLPGLGADVIVEAYVPILRDRRVVATLAVGYSLPRMLQQSTPRALRERYRFAIHDAGGNRLVSSSPRAAVDAAVGHEVPIDPPGHGLRLRADAFQSQGALVDRTLLAAVVALSAAILLSLLGLWRHARRRLDAEVERDRLFTLSLDIMCVLRPDGSFVRVNPAFRRVLGDVASQFRLSELAHPDDRGTVREALAALGGLGDAASPTTFEARFPVRVVAGAGAEDYRDHWLAWSITIDPQQGRRLCYAVAHDVTERKQAETALAAETAFRRAMEDSISTGMRAIDLEGRITYVNRAFCATVGYDAEELVGAMPPYPYWPPGEDLEHRRNLERILAGTPPSGGVEARVLRKDGKRLDVRMYVSPLVDRAGAHTGWMTSMADVTEPRRIREELAAAHERFATVLDELDAAVSVVAVDQVEPGASPGADAPLLFANRMYRRSFGDDAAGHSTLLGARGLRDPWMPVEVFHAPTHRRYEVRTRLIRWVDGGFAQMLVATDVTRRHEVEQLKRDQDEKLARSSRLVTMGEMASSLAHELNQPLTAIANYCMGMTARVRTRAARGEPLDPAELEATLVRVAGQAERAGQVIRRIREFVKRSEPERRRCDIDALVADAVGLAEIDAQRHGVMIEVDLPASTPALEADPILIGQVLLNLMKNGIEAMRDPQAPGRRLHVSVDVVDTAVQFSVTDQGRGVAPEALERLFEPFFTTKREGMGMGLNICRSIVEAHTGRLWLESGPGGGTTFRFTVPLPVPTRAAERDTVAPAQ